MQLEKLIDNKADFDLTWFICLHSSIVEVVKKTATILMKL